MKNGRALRVILRNSNISKLLNYMQNGLESFIKIRIILRSDPIA